LKHPQIGIILIGLLFSNIYLLLWTCNTSNSTKYNSKLVPIRPNAFIITTECYSSRFNATKENIERVFPNYFNIYCFKAISLKDPRIHTIPSSVLKKFSSNLISFATIWTYEIQKYSQVDDDEWSFVFEDDVNFLDPSKFSLPNYISALQELMNNPEIHQKHELFYLGICEPIYENNTQPLVATFSNNSLFSHKGYGFCAHAMGFTTRRARHFWTEISLYRPSPDAAIDLFLRDYCIRSGNRYYVLGSNFQWPPATGHYGIAFQDRGRFSSGMS
jgi:hypothetical protein